MFRRIGRILAFFATGFFIWSFFLVIAYGLLPPAVTPLMLLRLLDGAGIHKSWRPLSQISPNLVLAAMASEDSKFCAHDGFDWTAIRQDWQRNLRGGQLLGASTISMQTAKNLFLWPDRSWPRKGLEVYFTLLIELAWPKRRIMELYLNVVEWAPGIYGAEAASQFHFHKSAAALSAVEAARLVAVLPNPRRWSASHPTAYIVARASMIDARMPGTPAIKPLPCGQPEKEKPVP
jgi:monofunctional biosynthetic peptidoglycan transglycosylase